MSAPDLPNLLHRPDGAQLARTGPLALPGVLVGSRPGDPFAGAGGAQLALDGREEAPGPVSPPEGGDPSLGTLRDDLRGTPPGPPERPAGGARVQLRLDLDQWDAVPQRSLWDRRRVAAALADRVGTLTESRREAIDEGRQLAGGTQDNLAKCCRGVRRSSSTAPTMFRTSTGRVVWGGLVKCGDRCCPSCGVQWAEETAQTTDALIARWLDGNAGGLLDNDAWCLTIAPPHGPVDALKQSVDDLYTIWDRFTKSTAWRTFALRWGLACVDEHGRYRPVAAVVPYLDASFGGVNGPHVHLHVLLLVGGARVTGAQRRDAADRASPGRRPEEDGPALDAWRRRADRIADDCLRARDPGSRWEDAPLRALDRHERAVLCERFAADGGLWSALAECIRAVKPPSVERFGARRGERVPCHVGKSALHLQPGEDAARYFTSWGLHSELAGAALKGHSHLRLLDAALAGVAGAGETWRAYRAATKGRRWARGLGTACRRLGVDDEAVKARAAERRSEREKAGRLPSLLPVYVEVPAYLWGAARLAGLESVERAACTAVDGGGDGQAAVLALCWRYQAEANLLRLALARGRPPPS